MILRGNKHPVAVEGEERVLHLVELLEILRVAHANGVAVVIVAPGHQVTALDFHYPRVIGLDEPPDLRVVANPADRLGVNVEADAVFAAPGVNAHAAGPVVHPEHAGEALAERDHGAVEDAVGAGNDVARDDRVSAVAPDYVRTPFGARFPRYIWQRLADDGFRSVHDLVRFNLCPRPKLRVPRTPGMLPNRLRAGKPFLAKCSTKRSPLGLSGLQWRLP